MDDAIVATEQTKTLFLDAQNKNELICMGFLSERRSFMWPLKLN